MKIPPVAKLIFCLALAGSFSTYIPILKFHSSDWLIAVVVFLGIMFLLPAVISFIKYKTTVNPQSPSGATTLVTSGIYSISRNPMYVGMLVLLSAFVLWLGTISGFIAIGIFFLTIDKFQINSEEQSLQENFGDAFDAYATRVPRWLIFKKGVR